MAHFAELDDTNTVKQVIVIHNNEMLDENGVEQEQKGIDFCVNLLGGTWIQTSYNANIRKNFAGPGMIYDPIRDAFIAEKPYESWILNDDFKWEPPVVKPHAFCNWNEETISWDILPKPFESWIEDTETGWWKAPVNKPEGRYYWDEATVNWIEVATYPEPNEEWISTHLPEF